MSGQRSPSFESSRLTGTSAGAGTGAGDAAGAAAPGTGFWASWAGAPQACRGLEALDSAAAMPPKGLWKPEPPGSIELPEDSGSSGNNRSQRDSKSSVNPGPEGNTGSSANPGPKDNTGSSTKPGPEGCTGSSVNQGGEGSTSSSSNPGPTAAGAALWTPGPRDEARAFEPGCLVLVPPCSLVCLARRFLNHTWGERGREQV